VLACYEAMSAYGDEAERVRFPGTDTRIDL
jgi:hypothetical protein